MKKNKIFAIIISLCILVALTLAIAIPAMAASDVNDADWVSTGLSLDKCTGADCAANGHKDCDYVYSFAVIGDTQSINIKDVVYGTDNMSLIYRWLCENKSEYNIQYVMGVGDITESFNADSTLNRPGIFEYPDGAYSTYDEEWEHAKEAIALLDGNLDYSLVIGNHDNATGFNSTFGVGNDYYEALAALAATNDPEGRPMAGFYNTSKIENTYRKVIIGEHKYLIFTFERYPAKTEAVISWVDEVITANPDYSVIATLHQFMFDDGTILDPLDKGDLTQVAYERMLWEECLSKHKNVSMILSGHVECDDIYTTQLRGDNGNTVTCMLIDGQEVDMVVEPVGLVALLYFNAEGDQVGVEYLSSVKDINKEENIYLKSANQFTMDIDYSVSEDNDGWTETPYGYIPTEIFEAHTFHVLYDDDGNPDNTNMLFGSFDGWNETLTAIHAQNGKNSSKTFYIIMSEDYTTVSEEEDDNAAGKNPGKVVLDVNGHDFVMSSGRMLRLYNKNSSVSPEYTMTNSGNAGGITLLGGARILVTLTEPSTNGGTVTFNLVDIKVTYGEGASGAMISNSNNANANTPAYVNINLINCDIDSSATTSAVTYFKLQDTDNDNHVNLTIKGGSFKGNTNLTLLTLNEDDDKLTFLKDNSGNYSTTLTLNGSKTVSNEFCSEKAGESLKFVEGDNYVYTLVSTLANFEVTDYGNIDTALYPVETYPFVVFKDGEVKGAYTGWKSFIDGISGNADLRSGAVGYVRADYNTVDETSGPSSFGKIKDVTFDLGGKVLTSGGKHLFQIIGNSSCGDYTKITIKNGTLKSVSTGYSPIVFNDGADSTKTENFEIIINDVTFDVSTESCKAIMSTYESNGDNCSVKNKVILNNCTINRGSQEATMTMFGLKKNNRAIDTEVVINGGKIIADSIKNLSFASYDAGQGDKVIIGDEPMLFELSEGADVSAKTFALTEGTYALSLISDLTTATTKTYELVSLTTPYGEIPIEYASTADYPFVVFSSGKEFKVAFGDWYTYIYTWLNDGTNYKYLRNDCTVYLRRDYSTDESSGSKSSLFRARSLTFDLGGNTLTSGSKWLFTAEAKATSSYDTNVSVKNGTIVADYYAPVRFVEHNTSTVLDKFNFSFENVTFDVSYGANVVYCDKSGDDELGQKNTVTFTDCTFYRNSSNKSVTLFKVTDTNKYIDVSIIINGGEIIADSMTGLTVFSGDEGKDSITFAKGTDGKYTRLVLTKGQAAPTTDFGGLKFVKESEDGTTTTYILVPSASIGLDFTPKASVTLDSTLIFNIYLPDHAGLGTVTLNGAPVELGEANDGYYVISTPLTASESAEELKLVVNLTVDGTPIKGSFTFSTVKYAEKLLATAGISAAEQTLAKDMLAYINSAYVFFNGSAVAEITALLDGYTSKAVETTDAKQTIPGLSGATFVLDAKPAVRFYFADGYSYESFAFKVGNRDLTEKDIAYKDADYVEFSLYAYEMTEDFTYTVGGEPGAYNLASYYAYASGTGENDYKEEDKATLTDLVAKFYNYCLSAKAYRASVIGK